MSAYTDVERGLAVRQFGPKGPSHATSESGTTDKERQFKDVQEVVAWGFVSEPDIIFSYARMAVRKLLEDDGKFLAFLADLSTALSDMANRPSGVEDLTDLDGALSTASEMKVALASGSVSASQLSRFSSGILSFAEKLGDTARATGATRTPRDEAADKASDALEGMGGLYPDMLVIVKAVRNVVTDWASVKLGPIAGSGPLDGIIGRLEALKASPSDRQRAATLELLSSVARMDAAVSPRDPSKDKASSTGSADDGSRGVAALVAGTTSGPHQIGPPPGNPPSLVAPGTNPDTETFRISVDGGATKVFTLPHSTRASLSSRVVDSVVLRASAPATLLSPSEENYDFQIDTGANIEVTPAQDDAGGPAQLVFAADNPFVFARDGDLVHVAGQPEGNKARILNRMGQDRALVAGSTLVDGNTIQVYRDDRMTVIVDGVPQTATFSVTGGALTAVAAVATLSAALTRATVVKVGTKVRITSNSGLPDGETSLVVAPSRANAVFGWLDDPETTIPYPNPNGNRAYGDEGNNLLTLAVDEPLFPGNPIQNISLGSGTKTLAQIRDQLNGDVGFTGDPATPRAYAEVAAGRLIVRSQRYGRISTIRTIGTQSTCLDLMGLPADMRVRGADVTNQQVKEHLEKPSGNPTIDGVAEAVVSPKVLATAELTVDSAGVVTDPGGLGSVVVGDVAELEGSLAGTYHLAALLPNLTFTPGFVDLPSVGSTVKVRAVFRRDPLSLRSKSSAKASAIGTPADKANAELGFVNDAVARGKVDGWTDTTKDFRTAGARAGDKLLVGAEPARTVASILDKDTLVTESPDVVNNASGAYILRSLGLSEHNRIAKDSTSPLPVWLDSTLPVEGFEVGLGKLTTAFADAKNGSDLARRRAITLAAKLTDIWGDGPQGTPGLRKVLSDPEYAAPILPEAEEILRALGDLGFDEASSVLRQARFKDFFDLKDGSVSSLGRIASDLADLATGFPASKDEDFRERQLEGVESPSTDADYEVGDNYRTIHTSRADVAEDSGEIY